MPVSHSFYSGGDRLPSAFIVSLGFGQQECLLQTGVDEKSHDAWAMLDQTADTSTLVFLFQVTFDHSQIGSREEQAPLRGCVAVSLPLSVSWVKMTFIADAV